MDAIWGYVLIALAAGGIGAAVALAVRAVGSPAQAPPSASHPEAQLPCPSDCSPPTTPLAVPHDEWLRAVQRCEQAVYRAARVTEAVSSAEVRNVLHAVVRRMDAELPDARVLAELGRGLTDDRRDAAIAARVRGQLGAAATRFGAVTDQILDLVMQLVADPDHDRAHHQITALRQQFPLLHPISAVVTPAPDLAPPTDKFART